MTSSIFRVGAAAIALCSFLPTSLAAQSFSAAAITIDVDLDVAADNASEGLLIVAAYEPPSGAPRFGTRQSASTDARRTQDGKPAPSIILGRVMPGQEADFGIETILPETAKEFGFSYNDLEARNKMRSDNPDLFKRLVESGVLDPPATEEEALAVLEKNHARILQRASRKQGFTAVDTLLKVALQTELKRINCYTSSIDGDWGGGSKRSVTRFADQNKNAKTTGGTSANVDLFRAILLQGDAKCKVAAAPVKRKTTTKRSTTRRATTTRQQPARQTARQPARQPSSNSGGGGVSLGTGVFR